MAEIVAKLRNFSLHFSLAKLYVSPNYWDGIWVFVAADPALLADPWLLPALRKTALALSYGKLFPLRSGLRRIPSELYSADAIAQLGASLLIMSQPAWPDFLLVAPALHHRIVCRRDYS